jgi:hypothetical protein
MKISRLSVCSAFVIALGACSLTEPSSPPTPLSTTPSRGVASDEGVVLQVQGAGDVDLTAANAGEASFQFVATKRADGTVNGHFRQSRSTALGMVDFEGDVICVTIDPAFPGRARIGGRVTANNSTSPSFLTTNHEVGDDVWFRVEDGTLTGGVDRSTTYGFKPTLVDTSEQYCALPFDGLPYWNPASIFPLARGTVRVTVN